MNLPPPCTPKDVGARVLAQARAQATKTAAQNVEMDMEQSDSDSDAEETPEQEVNTGCVYVMQDSLKA